MEGGRNTRDKLPDERLVDFLYGEMPDEERREFLRQVDLKPELKAELEQYSSLKEKLDWIESPEPPPEAVANVLAAAERSVRGTPNRLTIADVLSWLLKPQLGLAAAALLVVALGTYMLREASLPESPESPEAMKEALKPAPRGVKAPMKAAEETGAVDTRRPTEEKTGAGRSAGPADEEAPAETMAEGTQRVSALRETERALDEEARSGSGTTAPAPAPEAMPAADEAAHAPLRMDNAEAPGVSGKLAAAEETAPSGGRDQALAAETGAWGGGGLGGADRNAGIAAVVNRSNESAREERPSLADRDFRKREKTKKGADSSVTIPEKADMDRGKEVEAERDEEAAFAQSRALLKRQTEVVEVGKKEANRGFEGPQDRYFKQAEPASEQAGSEVAKETAVWTDGEAASDDALVAAPEMRPSTATSMPPVSSGAQPVVTTLDLALEREDKAGDLSSLSTPSAPAVAGTVPATKEALPAGVNKKAKAEPAPAMFQAVAVSKPAEAERFEATAAESKKAEERPAQEAAAAKAEGQAASTGPDATACAEMWKKMESARNDRRSQAALDALYALRKAGCTAFYDPDSLDMREAELLIAVGQPDKASPILLRLKVVPAMEKKAMDMLDNME